MKTAETLLHYMDKLRNFFSLLDTYLEQGLKFISEAKKWLEKILDYLEQGLNALADRVGQKNGEMKHSNEEHMFV